MRIVNAFRLAVVLSALFPAAVLADPPPASTQPIMTGRDTPAGAMNTFNRAILNLDAATIADSYNFPPARRQDMAAVYISSMRFYTAAVSRFGKDATVDLCRQCRIPLPPDGHTFTDADWQINSAQPNVAMGQSPGASMMQRDTDGIWRMGRIFPRVSPSPCRPDSSPPLARRDSI
jgi:hypothetical protein